MTKKREQELKALIQLRKDIDGIGKSLHPLSKKDRKLYDKAWKRYNRERKRINRSVTYPKQDFEELKQGLGRIRRNEKRNCSKT